MVDIAAKSVARTHTFEAVQNYKKEPIPEILQQRITYYAFPEDEYNIRLYSNLANNSSEEFKLGEGYLRHKNVVNAISSFNQPDIVLWPRKYQAFLEVFPIKNMMQIGFQLCGEIEGFRVSICFDRGKITNTQCNCGKSMVFSNSRNQQQQQQHQTPLQNQKSVWCKHVVALCLFRIRYPHLVKISIPVSNTLARLDRKDLQKFAQYLLDAMPQHLLPIAQTILNELTCPIPNEIQMSNGGPDPTAGSMICDPEPEWFLDFDTLKLQINKEIHDFLARATSHIQLTAPGDMFGQSSNQSGQSPHSHQTAIGIFPSSTFETSINYTSLISPIVYKQNYSGIWHLMKMVKELFLRNDQNSYALLQALTSSMLANDKFICRVRIIYRQMKHQYIVNLLACYVIYKRK